MDDAMKSLAKQPCDSCYAKVVFRKLTRRSCKVKQQCKKLHKAMEGVMKGKQNSPESFASQNSGKKIDTEVNFLTVIHVPEN